MKKLTVGILASALLLVPLSANAAVSTKVDKSGTTVHMSQVNLSNPWDSVKVQYAPEKSLPTLTLAIGTRSSRNPIYYTFEKIQLITDDEISNMRLLDTYLHGTNNLGIFEFTPAQIASIQSAKKVSLRVSFSNVNTINWKVSEKVLNEWKEVFTKGQSQVSL